jgi:site-specific recombinase XerD
MSVFKRPGSDKWQLRFFYDGKIRVVSSKTTKKKLAQKQLEIIKAKIVEGRFKFIDKGKAITLDDYSVQFLDWVRIHRKSTTHRRYSSSLHEILHVLGKYKLANVKKSDIEKYKRSRIVETTGATINRDLACLKKLYNRAIAEGYCHENPVIGIDFFKEQKISVNYLSQDEAAKLIKSCDEEPIKLFVVLGLNTGMRTQEMLSLKWDNVNFADRTIILKDTKKGGDDSIPMNETVYELLKSSKQKSDYVISKSNGARYQDMRKPWQRILRLSGIKRCTPHVLRHTFATTLVREGADLLVVKALGRWSDLKLVERYAHVAKDHRTRAISMLDGKFSGDTNSDTVVKIEEKEDTINQ